MQQSGRAVAWEVAFFGTRCLSRPSVSFDKNGLTTLQKLPHTRIYR